MHLRQVAHPPEVIRIRVVGQLGDDEVVVFSIQGIEEPYLTFSNWARNGEPGRPLIQGDAFLVLQRRNEVGGEKAIVVVSDSAVQAEHAAWAFSILSGLTAGFYLDGTKGIRAHSYQQQAVGRLGDVSAVEQGQHLVGFRAGNVRLTGGVLYHSRNKIQSVAVIVCRRIWNVDDLQPGDFFFG